MIETLVTTKILGRIVEEAGDSQVIDDLLVGNPRRFFTGEPF